MRWISPNPNVGEIEKAKKLLQVSWLVCCYAIFYRIMYDGEKLLIDILRLRVVRSNGCPCRTRSSHYSML